MTQDIQVRLDGPHVRGFLYHDGHLISIKFAPDDGLHLTLECEGQRVRLEFFRAAGVYFELHGKWSLNCILARPVGDPKAASALSKMLFFDSSWIARAIDKGGWVFEIDDAAEGRICVLSECRDLPDALKVVRLA